MLTTAFAINWMYIENEQTKQLFLLSYMAFYFNIWREDNSFNGKEKKQYFKCKTWIIKLNKYLNNLFYSYCKAYICQFKRKKQCR